MRHPSGLQFLLTLLSIQLMASPFTSQVIISQGIKKANWEQKIFKKVLKKKTKRYYRRKRVRRNTAPSPDHIFPQIKLFEQIKKIDLSMLNQLKRPKTTPELKRPVINRVLEPFTDLEITTVPPIIINPKPKKVVTQPKVIRPKPKKVVTQPKVIRPKPKKVVTQPKVIRPKPKKEKKNISVKIHRTKNKIITIDPEIEAKKRAEALKKAEIRAQKLKQLKKFQQMKRLNQHRRWQNRDFIR